MTTIWWCEACHASGRVEYDEDEGVWEVFSRIMGEHASHVLRGYAPVHDAQRTVRVQLAAEAAL